MVKSINSLFHISLCLVSVFMLMSFIGLSNELNDKKALIGFYILPMIFVLLINLNDSLNGNDDFRFYFNGSWTFVLLMGGMLFISHFYYRDTFFDLFSIDCFVDGSVIVFENLQHVIASFAMISGGTLLYVLYRNEVLFKRFGFLKLFEMKFFLFCGTYYFIGMAFSVVFSIVFMLDPSAFSGNEVKVEDMIYFSFVTLTTLGYGDISPATNVSRTFALVEAVIGVFYIALFVGFSISYFLSERERESTY